ncbi:hypothetical protein BS50DRAFT_304916 [Corynespora cassiicola Philippines]|uniref:Uncharacterized protein n=1 Tax=Corynespora cassiicola Philippines TaxID=1448308 RepID=A0A2T2NXD7_CORCC|nr:hypothetical protein BS50DRAFT_304916 [Corynespora cassiicola Philippines]
MGILALSNELLREILDHIESDPEKLISLDRRAYLSQESFKPPPPPDRDQAQNIASFRLTCKRFSDLGALHQFSRVTTRFSRKGLKRLENIAGQEHLAKHVKKFSYMVPFFYVEGRERVHELLPTLPESLGPLDVRNFIRKVKEQKEIVQTQEDVRVLNKAISAFTSLQHVQILRLQDNEDAMLISYIRQYDQLNQLVELKWPPACSHSTKTIGAALLASRSPCSRFSSPMLSPQSALGAVNDPPTTLNVLAERLTCLELHFDDGTDLDNRMRELSTLSKVVFSAAKNMQAVHIGFPSHRPLSLKLEEIFHNVKWDKLLAFGIQAWRLDADEIIALARRHREKLRGLRLRDVLLRDGSRWKDILAFLREDMVRLDWVSLRRIDYEKHFDDQWVLGAEVPDEYPIGSDSDDESDPWSTHEDEEDEMAFQDNHIGDDDSDGSLDESDSDIGTEEPEQGGNLHFPPLSPDTPASVPWCNCNGHADSAETLGDDGVAVTYSQRKFWEKWVVRRSCTEHHHHK